MPDAVAPASQRQGFRGVLVCLWGKGWGQPTGENYGGDRKRDPDGRGMAPPHSTAQNIA